MEDASAAPPPHGYALALFTQPNDVDAALLCSICARVMKEPYICCEEGHGCGSDAPLAASSVGSAAGHARCGLRALRKFRARPPSERV
jgi:hypothetical protein